MDIVEEIPSGYRIEAVDSRSFTINNTQYHHSLLLTSDTLIPHPELDNTTTLPPDILSELRALDVEVVLIGTGAQQHLPAPAVYAYFAEKRMGLEVMDTPAASRTFNVLSSEARRVAALLILDNPSSSRS